MNFNNLQVNLQQIPRWFYVYLYLFFLALRILNRFNTTSKGTVIYMHEHTQSGVCKPVSSCSQPNVKYSGIFELVDKLLVAEIGHRGNIYTTDISKHYNLATLPFLPFWTYFGVIYSKVMESCISKRVFRYLREWLNIKKGKSLKVSLDKLDSVLLRYWYNFECCWWWWLFYLCCRNPLKFWIKLGVLMNTMAAFWAKNSKHKIINAHMT